MATVAEPSNKRFWKKQLNCGRLLVVSVILWWNEGEIGMEIATITTTTKKHIYIPVCWLTTATVPGMWTVSGWQAHSARVWSINVAHKSQTPSSTQLRKSTKCGGKCGANKIRQEASRMSISSPANRLFSLVVWGGTCRNIKASSSRQPTIEKSHRTDQQYWPLRANTWADYIGPGWKQAAIWVALDDLTGIYMYVLGQQQMIACLFD